jgi:hypothetical protein
MRLLLLGLRARGVSSRRDGSKIFLQITPLNTLRDSTLNTTVHALRTTPASSHLHAPMLHDYQCGGRLEEVARFWWLQEEDRGARRSEGGLLISRVDMLGVGKKGTIVIIPLSGIQL